MFLLCHLSLLALIPLPSFMEHTPSQMHGLDITRPRMLVHGLILLLFSRILDSCIRVNKISFKMNIHLAELLTLCLGRTLAGCAIIKRLDVESKSFSFRTRASSFFHSQREVTSQKSQKQAVTWLDPYLESPDSALPQQVCQFLQPESQACRFIDGNSSHVLQAFLLTACYSTPPSCRGGIRQRATSAAFLGRLGRGSQSTRPPRGP